MKIAIPLADGRLSMHFGHSEYFAILDVDPATKAVLKREDIEAPPHQPGLLPPWLKSKGVDVVITGGMGQRALSLFREQGVEVVVGAPSLTPEEIANSYLNGTLITGQNVCDH